MDALAEIRGKTYGVNNLMPSTELSQSVITYGITIFIPILMIIFGLLRWFVKRRSTRRKIERLMASLDASK